MLQQLGWTTLEQRRTEASLGFLYNIVNEKVAVGRKKHLERPYNTSSVNNLNNDIVNSASFKQFEAPLKDNTYQ